MKDPDEVNRTASDLALRTVEIGIGFFLPLFVAGPFLMLGFVFGLVALFSGGEATLFFLSLCGLCGLLGLGNLLFRQDKFSRRQAELSTAGVFAGILAVLWFLGNATRQPRHFEKQVLFWAAVLMPPAILGFRRVILLWKNQTF